MNASLVGRCDGNNPNLERKLMRNVLIALSVVILLLMFVTALHAGQCPCANGRCPTFSATVTIPPAPAVTPTHQKPVPPAAKFDGSAAGNTSVVRQAPADRGTRWYPGKRVRAWLRGR